MNTHSYPSRRVLELLLATVLLAGCVAQVPYPADWDPVAVPETGCPDLSGYFQNLAAVSSDDAAAAGGLPLTQMFFDDLLEGFAVTHLVLESLADGGLRVTPWVGETKLREERIVTPGEMSCEDGSWVFETEWNVSGWMIADGIFWTAGILVPAAKRWSFALGRDAQEHLVVHAVGRLGGTVLLIVPFSSREYEAWFSYAPYLPGVDDLGD